MKIRIEQLNTTVGDIAGNKSLILNSLKKAENDGAELLILQEMVVTGYPPQDLLENKGFREAVYNANEDIIKASGSTAVLFGSITPNENGTGRKMYNSALLAKNGVLEGITHKTLLPTYDIFDDLRYFEPNTEFRCLELNGIKLGVTICEDIWYNENEVQYHTYSVDPAEEQKKAGAQCIINISASPYTNSKHQNRVQMLRNHARRLKLPIFYSNQAGTHTDVIFDGDSLALNADAELVAVTQPFESSFVDVDWDPATGEVVPRVEKRDLYPESKQERQFCAIRSGLSDYVKKTGITDTVVVGLSGGIDSALVCVLAAESLGADKVKAITMPGRFSSEGSVTDSRKLAENLGIELIELSIEELYECYNRSLEPVFGDLPFGVAEENLQSRIRGSLLMAYANKFNSFVLATGNKSEYAVGYATLYGDMNGALAVIGDLYKTEVYELCRWLNESYYKREIIPGAIITKPPSAELRPNQKDSDSLPEYEVLDSILFEYIENQKSKKEICAEGFGSDIVEKVIRLVDQSEFKRFQAAPILKLSSKSFGSGRRWPIVQKWTS